MWIKCSEKKSRILVLMCWFIALIQKNNLRLSGQVNIFSMHMWTIEWSFVNQLIGCHYLHHLPTNFCISFQ